jgi:transposase
MEKRQKFTPEFKREAVRLLQKAHKPAAAVARELGVLARRLG